MRICAGFKFLLVIFFVLNSIRCVAGEVEQGRVVKVIDGDSLVVRTSKSMVEIRLYGIDSPEYGQPYSSAAKQFVKNMTNKKPVQFKPLYKDTYGRTVAVVQMGPYIVNQELVANGLAWVYGRYCRKEICKYWRKLEERAKMRRKGLWAAPNPMPPWKYKRRRN